MSGDGGMGADVARPAGGERSGGRRRPHPRYDARVELAGVPRAAFEEALAAWDTLLAEAGADGVPVIMLLFPDRTVLTEDGRWDFARPATKLLHERLAEHFRDAAPP